MKIINTIKKYFLNTQNENINLVKTSSDQVFDKLSLQHIDEKISNIENYLEVLKNYVEPVVYSIPSTTDFSTNFCNLTRIGKLIIISGHLFRKTTGTGSYQIPLGVDVRPHTQVCDWNKKVLSGGNEYRIHFEILRENKGVQNESILNVYMYDDFPTDRMIPINLVYVLDHQLLKEENNEE